MILTVFLDLQAAFSVILVLISHLILFALKDKGLAKELFFIFNFIFWTELAVTQYRYCAYKYQGFLFTPEFIHQLGQNSPTSPGPIFSLRDIKNPYSKEHVHEVILANMKLLQNKHHIRSFFFFLNSQQGVDDYQKELIRLISHQNMDEFFQQICLNMINGKSFNAEALATSLKFHSPLSKNCELIIDRTGKKHVGQI